MSLNKISLVKLKIINGLLFKKCLDFDNLEINWTSIGGIENDIRHET